MFRVILVIVFSAVSIECATHNNRNIIESIICEWQTLNIGCKTGEVIQIISANYGRTDGTTCPNGPISNQNCFASTSLTVVNERCNNKKRCTISATNNAFGDPCEGTHKYLFIKYKCSPDIKEVTACEWQTLNIQCETGETIQIKSAEYGRRNDTFCRHESALGHNCVSSTSLEVVNKICNNKQQCTVKAINDVFGDPCLGTFKYLFIKYRCVSDIKESIACETQTLNMVCQSWEVIQTISAEYGRRNDIICPHSSPQGQNCVTSTALAVVNEICNDKQQCTVGAKNELFGDPCYGTHKYLFIKYQCSPEQHLNIVHQPQAPPPPSPALSRRRRSPRRKCSGRNSLRRSISQRLPRYFYGL